MGLGVGQLSPSPESILVQDVSEVAWPHRFPWVECCNHTTKSEHWKWQIFDVFHWRDQVFERWKNSPLNARSWHFEHSRWPENCIDPPVLHGGDDSLPIHFRWKTYSISLPQVFFLLGSVWPSVLHPFLVLWVRGVPIYTCSSAHTLLYYFGRVQASFSQARQGMVSWPSPLTKKSIYPSNCWLHFLDARLSQSRINDGFINETKEWNHQNTEYPRTKWDLSSRSCRCLFGQWIIKK